MREAVRNSECRRRIGISRVRFEKQKEVSRLSVPAPEQHKEHEPRDLVSQGHCSHAPLSSKNARSLSSRSCSLGFA